ncbi:MAG: ABC transporter ATP-binding protein, partial [Ruminococcus sp.]|nr:ABC transporter ATP-binding protein [Ruminococcus sp.]
VDNIVRVMRENITGIRVVKALSKEDYEKRRFAQANEDMTKKDIHASMLMSLPGPIATLFLNCGLVLVVIIGANRVNEGLTQPGVILAFLTYFNMILMGVMGLNRIFMLISKANASAKRIEAVIQMEDELTPISKQEAAKTDRDEFIIFDHVTFNYGADSQNVTSQSFTEGGRKKCLNDIDFSMKKGGTLGIIGATGCGKTTIINLLMRFYDANSGHIFVDGKDVRTYDKDDLHRMFGVVFQNDVIFADTLKENISFGRDVDDDSLVMAVDDARAREFIEAYEDTYEHKAVIHGANLSGGQRQRVLIARALAAHPQILVLDDSSSALDYKTDAMLRKAIAEHHADTTMIVIAQRISSIMNLDDIIVLEEGNIIGHGTHEELMKDCKMYQDIYKTQMGEMK